MKNYFKLAVGCFALVSSITVAADGVKFSGNAEAGYNFSWQKADTTNGTAEAKDNGFMVDNVTLSTTANVSDKVKVVIDNALHLNQTTTTGTAQFGTGFNSAAYGSRAVLAGAGGGRLTYRLDNTAAYIEHKCSEHISYQLGHISIPFGTEMGGERYDMTKYYYSYGNRMARVMGWDYDLGLKANFAGLIPGNLQVAVFDGRATTTANPGYSPGLVARWAMDNKNGDMTISPSAGILTNRWRGGPQDIGATAGIGFKMGMMSANAEFVYLQSDTNVMSDAADEKSKDWSIAVEPGVDLSFATISIPWEYFNHKSAGAGATAVSDMNLGFALTHEYGDKLRIRLAYEHVNLGGKGAAATPAKNITNNFNGNHGNDFRILIGTKW